MKRTTKIISCLMAVAVMLACFPVCGVFASDPQGQDDAIAADGLEFDIRPGKSNYAYSETAAINVTLTNKYDFPVDNVTVYLYSGSCKLPKGSKNISEEMTLEAGESKTVTFNVKLGDSSKLNIFQKILFFFRNLFSPSDSFKPIDEKESLKCSSSFNVRFGPADCAFDVTAYFTHNMQVVDETLEELLQSHDFQITYSNDIESALEIVENKLVSMENKELVADISSDGKSEVWFEYLLDDGQTAIGGVDLTPPEEGKNSPANAVQAAGGSSNAPAGSMMFFDALTSEQDFSSSLTLYNIICSSLGKYNSPSEHLSFSFSNCKNPDYYKSALVCLSAHGGVTDPLKAFGAEMPYMLLSDCPKGKRDFANDIANHAAGTLWLLDENGVAQLFGVLFPKFYEQMDFSNTVVFMENCCGFGNKGSADDAFANVFKDKGCLAVIGFQYDVNDNYSNSVLENFISQFRNGETLANAIAAANEYAINNVLHKTPDSSTGILQYRFKNSGSETIFDCGPDAGNLAGIRLKFVDDSLNETSSYLIPVKGGTELHNSDILGYARNCGDGWDTYSLAETVNYTAAAGEIREFTIDVTKN